MSEFNKYSTDGGATFIDVEDSNAVHWSQAEGYVGKNRNSMPYYASSGTTHGITKVINADGTININNTTTGTDFVEFHQCTLHNNNTDLYLPIGDYYVTIEADKSIDVSKTHFTVNRTVNGSDVGFNTSKNIGSTYHFSITADTTCDYKKSDGSCLVGFYVYFDSGLAFNDVTIKPMIRLSSISDSTFEPWYMSNRELTDDLTPIEGSFDYTYTASSTTPSPNTGRTHIFNVDKIAVASLWVTNCTISSGSWQEICRTTLKPKKETVFPVFLGGGKTDYGRIDTNGVISGYFQNALSAAEVHANFTYILT